MDVVSISEGRFNKLEPLGLDDINIDGTIYEFKYAGKKKLLKSLYFNEGVILARKLYTIEILNSNLEVLPDYFIVPESFVFVSHKIVGLLLPHINGISLKGYLSNDDFSIEDKIKYLKKVGYILEKMKKIRKFTSLKDFYLNDIHESNFMVDFNTGNLCVIDLDSCKIDTNIGFPARYLTKYSLASEVFKYRLDNYEHGGYVIINQDTDLYCYIIMIMNYLYGGDVSSVGLEEFYRYLDYLNYVGLNKDLIKCFSKIVSDGSNINPVEYLDTLNSEQICRSKKIVFEQVRKKHLF